MFYICTVIKYNFVFKNKWTKDVTLIHEYSKRLNTVKYSSI